MSLLTPERLSALAAAAVAAPSADNHHVIRLAAQGDRLQLLADPELIRASRMRRILGLVSAGAVAENLMLRGLRLGLRLEPRWHVDGGGDALLAEFACSEAEPAVDPLDDAIESRHTNRRLRFAGPSLSAEQQEQLSADAAKIAGAALHWLDAPSRRRQALRLVRWAETERFRNRALHSELFGSIRFDVGWRASADHGLPPASLELPRLERPAFSLLRHWSVQRTANLAGTHHFIGFRAAVLPCRLAPHLAAIAVAGEAEGAAFGAGRALQRVWLRAASLGLAFQVYAASAFYALEGMAEIPADLRQRLRAGWDALLPGTQPLMVFRLGYAQPATVRAGRPDHATLLVLPKGTP
jgi:hypothetical protein